MFYTRLRFCVAILRRLPFVLPRISRLRFAVTRRYVAFDLRFACCGGYGLRFAHTRTLIVSRLRLRYAVAFYRCTFAHVAASVILRFHPSAFVAIVWVRLRLPHAVHAFCVC